MTRLTITVTGTTPDVLRAAADIAELLEIEKYSAAVKLHTAVNSPDPESPSFVASTPDLSGPVETLGLSVRQYNCLKTGRVDTLGDLVRMSADQLLYFRNMGKKSVDDIRNKLKAVGLGLQHEGSPIFLPAIWWNRLDVLGLPFSGISSKHGWWITDAYTVGDLVRVFGREELLQTLRDEQLVESVVTKLAEHGLKLRGD